MNPYEVWARDNDDDGRLLVFAKTAQKAKQWAWVLSDEYTEFRAKRLSDKWKVYAEQDGEHEAGLVPACYVCNMWIAPGLEWCESCSEWNLIDK